MSITEWFQQLNFDSLISGGMVVVAALLSITFHETCHGLVANWLGDPTAKNDGRLTLNPLKHVDLVGLAMLVIFRFGWAKPVPVDARNFRHPKRDMVLTALAGPLSNLVLALAALMVEWILRLLFSLYSAPEALWYLPLLLELSLIHISEPPWFFPSVRQWPAPDRGWRFRRSWQCPGVPGRRRAPKPWLCRW